MGKAIESILIERGHTTIPVDSPEERKSLNNTDFDAAIEFSMPESAYENIRFALDHNIPVLSGTTGWLNRKQEIENHTKKSGGSFFYASNYSLGVNIFFQLNKKMAEVMNKFPEYDVSMKEVHHTKKLDSPSGTAITLADLIIQKMDRKSGWKENTDQTEFINIKAERIGEVPGTHHVMYSSEIDSIELTHTAHSRAGFAMGAVLVAEWIADKKGVLSMDDFLGDLMN